MFTHQTILMLRAGLPAGASSLPLRGHFRDYHFVRNLMEVKQHLLACLRNERPAWSPVPDVILVDVGANNSDIRSELLRWMEKHPRLDHIRVAFPRPRPRPWVVRAWTRLINLGQRSFCLTPAVSLE